MTRLLAFPLPPDHTDPAASTGNPALRQPRTVVRGEQVEKDALAHPPAPDDNPAPACLRIAMVAACRFPYPQGSQVLIGQLAAALAQRGHAVRLLTYPDGSGRPPDGVTLRRVAALPGLAGDYGPLSPLKAVLDLRLAAALRRLAREWQPDVVHAHNVEGVAVALAARAGRPAAAPVVYHVHNAMGLELHTYFRRRPARWLARQAGRWLDGYLPRRAAGCIVLNETALPYFRRRGATRLSFIPPGIDLAPGDARRARQALGAGPLVIYAGNLDGYQDLELLLHAFRQVAAARPAARLVLSTAAHARMDEWRARVAALGIDRQTMFVPAGDFGAVRDLLAAADVAVCPRLACLGWPIKLLNYMAAGRPIVVSAGSACGLRHMETAWLVENGDASAMAAAIVALLDDPALAARLGAAARRAAETRHGWDRVAEAVEALYAELLQRNHKEHQEHTGERSRL